MPRLETEQGSRARSAAGHLLASMGFPHEEHDSAMKRFPVFEGFGIREIAREFSNSSETGLRALTTGDFPKIVGDALNVAVDVGYNLAGNTWARVVQKKQATNFKESSIVRLAPAPEFPKVGEDDEYLELDICEGEEKYKVETYGGIITFSRQLIVNDDMGALKDIGRMHGLTARSTQSRRVYSTIMGNPKLSDGIEVFSASRGNLLTGADTVLGRESLGTAIKVMRLMADDKENPLSPEPKYLLVPPSLEMTAHELCYSDSVPNQDNSAVLNFFKKIGITPIVEPLLENPNIEGHSSTAWYLFPDPEIFPVFAAITLGPGNNFAPSIFSQEGWTSDGIQYKARIDFAAAAIGNKAVKCTGE